MNAVATTPDLSTEVLAVLRRVRTRLTLPSAWLQGDFSRTLEGAPCSSSCQSATCWCLEGAIGVEIDPQGVFGPDTLTLHRAVYAAVSETVGLHGSGLTLAGWNDAPGRTHDEVLGVLTLTITRLEQATGAAA
ncbi:DUF6197 family protein [Luteitalea sp.]